MNQEPRKSESGERLASLEQWIKNKDNKDDERHRNNTERLDAILIEVKRTNGRVLVLEKFNERIKGGWWLAVILAGIIGFFLRGLVFK